MANTAAPLISVTNPTPPRSTNSRNSTYRLLYRGALSLPDSHLLLDGLTFTTQLDSPSKNNHLLQNPLALALESMRGRPSLRFAGVIKLNDSNIWLDESGGIEMDIHPHSTLTRIYFENMFCLIPLPESNISLSKGTSDIGIKISLGDNDGPDTTHVVIFARSVDETNNIGANQTLNLIVARLMSHPRPSSQPSSLRLPRPDDPTPRKPPVLLGVGMGTAKRELKRVASMGLNIPGRGPKKVGSTSSVMTKRRKLVGGNGNLLADLGSGVRLEGNSWIKDKVLFKVPDIPGKLDIKGKGRVEEDVFRNVDKPDTNTSVLPGHTETEMKSREDANEMEKANKNIIKRCTLDYLYKSKDPATTKVNKSRPEFKELYGWIYRGVGYALRAQMKARPINPTHVAQLVQMHIDMYTGGHGGMTVDP